MGKLCPPHNDLLEGAACICKSMVDLYDDNVNSGGMCECPNKSCIH